MNKALSANDMCGVTQSKTLPILHAFMPSHCSLSDLVWVYCNTLLLKDVLLSHPDIQIFSQSLVPSYMGAPYRQDAPSQWQQIPLHNLSSCLSFITICICSLHHSISTKSQFIQQHCSCEATCGILVPPTCFWGRSHFHTETLRRHYSTLFLRCLLFLLAWIFGFPCVSIISTLDCGL